MSQSVNLSEVKQTLTRLMVYQVADIEAAASETSLRKIKLLYTIIHGRRKTIAAVNRWLEKRN